MGEREKNLQRDERMRVRPETRKLIGKKKLGNETETDNNATHKGRREDHPDSYQVQTNSMYQALRWHCAYYISFNL